MADQKEVVVYVCRRSWRCWLTSRLLGRRGHRFEMIDATNNPRLCSQLEHFTGRETMPYVFIDHRPVGGLSEIRALERSGALEHLVRGGVQDASAVLVTAPGSRLMGTLYRDDAERTADKVDRDSRPLRSVY